MSRRLVAYFSATGVTARAAKQLADVTGADIFAIEPAEPYARGDLDWTNRKSRSSVEMNDGSSRPEMKERADLSKYDTVYIGFPVWWGVAPRIINTFIESAELEGKTVMLFATSGGSGISHAVEELRRTYPELNITGGKLLNGPVKGDIL
jgi:flavodoxin